MVPSQHLSPRLVASVSEPAVVFLVSCIAGLAGVATTALLFQCRHCKGELLEAAIQSWKILCRAEKLVSNGFLYLVLFGMRVGNRLSAGQKGSSGLGEFACDSVGL